MPSSPGKNISEGTLETEGLKLKSYQKDKLNNKDQNQNQNQIRVERSKFAFDEFVPREGVTLLVDNRMKEGPHHKNFQNFEQLEAMMRLNRNNDSIHITKSEY